MTTADVRSWFEPKPRHPGLVETGALRPGEQLPGIRPLAEDLVINVNTVEAYREIEHEGVLVT